MQLPNLQFEIHPFGQGVRARYKSWSIIKIPGSYGYEQGLYEVMGPGFGDEDEVEGSLTLGEIMTRISAME